MTASYSPPGLERNEILELWEIQREMIQDAPVRPLLRGAPQFKPQNAHL